MVVFSGFGSGANFDNAYHRSGDSARAASSARQASTNVRFVQSEVDRLELLCEGMWNLLKKKTGLTDDDLLSEVAALDLSDGQADGKRARGPVKCPKCNRPNSRQHDFCLYCGELIRTTPFQ